ncbi:MAG: hypothetical protein ABW075_04560, partial [Aeromicrobium sp.]
NLRQPTPGVFEWTTRTGHTYTRHPDPLPTADWDLTTPTHHRPDHMPTDQMPTDPWAAEFAQMLQALTAA